MNSKKKDDSNKQSTVNKKQKSTRPKKINTQRPGKKRPPKSQKQPPQKNGPLKKTVKNQTQTNKNQQNKTLNNKEAKQPEAAFITKPTIEDEWNIDNIERYISAVRKAFEKIPETEKKEIDLREIWLNSSLPADLILKIINDHGEKIGITKNSLFLDGKVVY